jgi:hypothetical protein
MACPNDCSGHGSCHLSACACDGGWLGADCSQAAPADARQGLPWWGVLLLQVRARGRGREGKGNRGREGKGKG